MVLMTGNCICSKRRNLRNQLEKEGRLHRGGPEKGKRNLTRGGFGEMAAKKGVEGKTV